MSFIRNKLYIVLSFFALFLIGCEQEPGSELPAFHDLQTSIVPIHSISPELAKTYEWHVTIAQKADAAGDTATVIEELNALMATLIKLPDTETANTAALNIVQALDSDLERMMATRTQDKVSANHNWNMKCGPAYTCVVQRGNYCRQLFLNGQLVGCATGRMPNAPQPPPVQS